MNGSGALSYENWTAYNAGEHVRLTEEYPLFSDAVIFDELKDNYGPYQVINTVSNQIGFSYDPAMILRLDYATDLSPIPLGTATFYEQYHGGWISDEIAALISLLLGIRVKAGASNRVFDPAHDPKGLPIYAFGKRNPMVQPPTDRPILASAVGQHNLADASLLSTFPDIPVEASVTLIRAARLFQDAIWIVETEPSLSWIMLVSAIETAAGFWRSASEPAVDRVKESRPELAEFLVETGGETLLSQVALMIADQMGAGRKFADFLLQYLPPPPPRRPAVTSQHPWEPNELKRSFRIIYNWRSKALHGGIPFPEPMCIPPFMTSHAIPDERSSSPAMGTASGIWRVEDTPMHLHTFEYIVRNSLLRWWASLLNSKPELEG